MSTTQSRTLVLLGLLLFVFMRGRFVSSSFMDVPGNPLKRPRHFTILGISKRTSIPLNDDVASEESLVAREVPKCVSCSTISEISAESNPFVKMTCGHYLHFQCFLDLFKNVAPSTAAQECSECKAPISYINYVVQVLIRSSDMIKDFRINPLLLRDKEFLLVSSVLKQDNVLAMKNLMATGYFDFRTHLFKEKLNVLHVAAAIGAIKVILWFLDESPIKFEAAELIDKALFCACTKGHLNTAELLLNRGASVNSEFKNNSGSALISAIRSNSPALVKLLVDRGASVDFKFPIVDVGYPLQFAVHQKVNSEILTYLLQDKLYKDARIKELALRAALLESIKMDNVAALRLLVEKGVNMNGFCSQGYGLFHQAILSGSKEVIKYWISQSFSISLSSHQPSFLIHRTVASKNSPEFLDFLLSIGGNINEQIDEYYLKALQASNSGNPIVKRFTRRDPPTLNAIFMRRLEMMRVLLKHGADPNSRVFSNTTTLLHLAVEFQLPEFFKLLVSSGADTNAIDYEGRTALSMIASDKLSAFTAN